MKAVLVTNSDYFKALLGSGMKETADNKVTFDYVTSNIADVIEYMYTSCIELNVQNIEEINEISRYFQVNID